MGKWEIKQCDSSVEAVWYLNGDVIGTKNLHSGAAVDGLTLIVDVGSGNETVTFAPALGRLWTFTEIVAAINAAVPDLAAGASIMEGNNNCQKGPDRRLRLANSGTLVVVSSGTANAVLGFSSVQDTTGIPVAFSELQNSAYNNDLHKWALVIKR